MRKTKGKLISVWVPGNHGAGGSTIADSLGIGLQYLTDKKLLLANLSGSWSYMERFFENDIDIKYTMDYYKGFGNDIELNHINTFAAHINERLSILPGSRLDKDITGDANEFEHNLLEKCLEGYDIVIVDVISGVGKENRDILNKSDIILAVMTPNEIMMDDLYKEINKIEIYSYLKSDKTISVFNMMNPELDINKELDRLCKKYKINSCYGICFDGGIFEACCKDRKIYTYLMREFQKKSYSYTEELEILCKSIIEKLDIEIIEKESEGFLSRFFKSRQVRKQSEKAFGI